MTKNKMMAKKTKKSQQSMTVENKVIQKANRWPKGNKRQNDGNKNQRS